MHRETTPVELAAHAFRPVNRLNKPLSRQSANPGYLMRLFLRVKVGRLTENVFMDPALKSRKLQRLIHVLSAGGGGRSTSPAAG